MGIEPPLNQPSGAQLPLSQSSGAEPLTVQTSGTEPLINETSGTEPSHVQPSGIQVPISLLSGEQAIRATSPVKAPSAPMPSFTSQGPGTTRIAAQIRGATLKSPTKTTQVREITNARDAKVKEVVRQQRNGTGDGIPGGMNESCRW